MCVQVRTKIQPIYFQHVCAIVSVLFCFFPIFVLSHHSTVIHSAVKLRYVVFLLLNCNWHLENNNQNTTWLSLWTPPSFAWASQDGEKNGIIEKEEQCYGRQRTGVEETKELLRWPWCEQLLFLWRSLLHRCSEKCVFSSLFLLVPVGVQESGREGCKITFPYVIWSVHRPEGHDN